MDRYAPPTPTTLLSGLSEERHRLWGQSNSTDAQLLSATSQVMQMSSSPLLDGEFLLQGNKKVGRPRKLGRRSPAEDIMDADDSNDTYDGAAQRGMKKAIMQSMNGHGTTAGAMATSTAGATSRGAGRKKKFVSPDSSVEVNSVSELLSLSGSSFAGRGQVLSPTGTSSAVEKLSLTGKNQKLGMASAQNVLLGTALAAQGVTGSGNGNRRLKSQPSQLENYDLSQYFGGKNGVEDGQGDDSNNSLSMSKDGKAVATVTPSASAARGAETTTVCNCKKSKCLKLYCDCFAVMNYCSGGCNCFDCCNRTEREAIRQDAIKCTKERNALAFQTKISNKDQHLTGCHCKNSQCLKKYCECYTGGAFCGTNCKCQMCLNFNGSADLIKARSSARDSDGASRKRKESPSSVAFLENNSPPGSTATAKTSGLGVGSVAAQAKDGAQNITFSPELRASLGLGGVAPGSVGTLQAPSLGRATAANSAVAVATAQLPALSGRGPLTRGGSLLVTPAGSGKGMAHQQAHLTTPTPAHAQMVSTPAAVTVQDVSLHQTAKRSKTQATPVPVDRQLRSRKLSGDSEEGAHSNSNATGLSLASAGSVTRGSAPAPTSGGKKRQVKFAPIPIVYPFFGAGLPPTSKLIALKCLDFLEGKDIYAMSQVNTLWNAAAMDDALWE